MCGAKEIILALTFFLLSGCALTNVDNVHFHVEDVVGEGDAGEIYLKVKKVRSSYPFYSHNHSIDTLVSYLFEIDADKGEVDSRGRKLYKAMGDADEEIYRIVERAKKSDIGMSPCSVKAGTSKTSGPCLNVISGSTRLSSLDKAYEDWEYKPNEGGVFWRFSCVEEGGEECSDDQVGANLIELDVFGSNGKAVSDSFGFLECQGELSSFLYGKEFFVFFCNDSRYAGLNLAYVNLDGKITYHNVLDVALNYQSVVYAWLNALKETLYFVSVDNGILVLSTFIIPEERWGVERFKMTLSRDVLFLEQVIEY